MRGFALGNLLVFITMISAPAFAGVRISDDLGGRIGTYFDRYTDLRRSGEHVTIDGTCLSACTMVLGIVPKQRICVTRQTVLGFHAAWFPDQSGQPQRNTRGEVITNLAGTRKLMEIYPRDVRRWINAHGGLTSKMLELRGRELLAMYPECGADSAFASTGSRGAVMPSSPPPSDIHRPH